MSNNNNQEPKIEPETPEMRSVLIRSAPAAPSMVSSPVGLSFSKPAPVVLRVPTPPAPASGEWSPTDPLPKVPEFYHLGNSHAKIAAKDGKEIANRIAECLSKQSIAATFSENQAIAETACHTKMHVTLFEDDNQVIVEVQRRSGCGFAFSKCSKAILRAAKGMPSGGAPRTFAIPASILNCNDKKIPTAQYEAVAERLVEPSQKYDSQMLGMQSLARQSQKKEFEMNSETLDTVLKHVVKDCSDSLPEPYASCARRDALTTLAGGLEHSNVPSSLITSRVLQQLLQDLVHDCPHVAYQAARCLTVLVSTAAGDFKSHIAKLGGVPTSLPIKEKTLALEQETRKLQLELR